MSEKSMERVIVTVDEAHLSHIQSLASTLRSSGMHVSNVLPTSGIITGEVSSDELDQLKQLNGVLSVEPDEEMGAI